MELEIRNKKWSDDEFYKVRKEILNTWETGKEVDLDEAIAFHKSLPEHKVFSNKLNKAKAIRQHKFCGILCRHEALHTRRLLPRHGDIPSAKAVHIRE